MLELVIPETEQYDEANDRFITTKKQVLRLEHSLVSLSKWESNVAALRDCLAIRAEYALKYLQKEFGVSDEKMQEYRAKALAASA